MIAFSTITSDYWETFEVNQSDLEFLYNHLLELELPQTSQELVQAIIANRIKQLKEDAIRAQTSLGEVYKPRSNYDIGKQLIFSQFEWSCGEVINKRPGINPEAGNFNVIEVKFEDNSKRLFACDLDEHKLNSIDDTDLDDPNLKIVEVLSKFNKIFISQLNKALEKNQDLVQIAGRWFPQSLLININLGYLNLAEAVLDIENGGPLPTSKILEQIELPTDLNSKLSEFSLNYALQEDDRFDEVGPAGKTLWFLKRLEPQGVLEKPIHLIYNTNDYHYDHDKLSDYFNILDHQLCDELHKSEVVDEVDDITISLIFPHWLNGTLPLSDRVKEFFPTAYEAPRVQFNFIDSADNTKYSGWVIRTSGYIYGLKEWYEKKELLPGSLINIKYGKNPGEVIITSTKRRSTREWIRTALVGTDGEIVFATLKQVVTSDFDERMVIAIPDFDNFDSIWKATKQKPIENVVHKMVRELAKLNPQGHVHALEVYSAVNLVRRCPPGPILDILLNSEWSHHFGDLHFHLKAS